MSRNTIADGYVGILSAIRGGHRRSVVSDKFAQIIVQIQVTATGVTMSEVVEIIRTRLRKEKINATVFSSLTVVIDNVKSIVIKVVINMDHRLCTILRLNNLLRTFGRFLRDTKLMQRAILGTVSRNNLPLGFV